ncbi:MAG: DUF1822 family protein [Elainellaceae cyanobacterium]
MTQLSSASQLFLEVAPNAQAQSWQASQSETVGARWHAYLNRLCLSGALPWLQELGFDPAEIAAAVRSHRTIWSLVGGSAVLIDSETRLVLIPSEATDVDELRIPQEWVDIPSWAGNYYVGVRVSPDGDELCLWGYATHAQVKQQGHYAPSDRTYCLAGAAVGDLAVLSVVRALCPQEAARLSLPPLPELLPAQAEALIQRLGYSDSLMLRLEVPFTLWGALLENEAWRSRLHEMRQADRAQRPPRAPTNLGQWLGLDPATLLVQGWQPLEALLPASPQVSMTFRDVELNKTAGGGKRLTLGRVTVILLLEVELEADGRVRVRVQLRPDEEARLPEGVELGLLSPSGEVVQTVQSRAIDDYIQLKRFRLPAGYAFTVWVSLWSETVLEPFTT